MNIWHDIQPRWIEPENFTACVEIPKGSKTKYELDKETGRLRLDRILYTATHYPENYGFIPRTFGEDLDPLDVLVICSERIEPMALVQCYPIGFIHMVDSGKNDEKVIAIPFSDPMYNTYKDIKDLPAHIFDQMEHFFKVYKTLENKETSVYSVQGREEAVAVIAEAIESYTRLFGGRERQG